MKAIFYIILFNLVTIGYAQNETQTQIVYNISFLKDSINIFNFQDYDVQTQKTLDNLYMNAIDVEGVLSIKGDESLYKVSDPLEHSGKKEINITKIFGGSSNFYYSNNLTGEILCLSNATNQWYLISHKKKDWTITEETKIINNYKCIKAVLISEPKTYAWFTPELPIRFGPLNYHGLPGLVIEMQFAKFLFSLKSIDLNPKEFIEVVKPTLGTPITYEGYKEKFGGIFKE